MRATVPATSISVFRGIDVPMKPVLVATLGHDRPISIVALGYDNTVRTVRVSTSSLPICITSVMNHKNFVTNDRVIKFEEVLLNSLSLSINVGECRELSLSFLSKIPLLFLPGEVRLLPDIHMLHVRV
jgi:hypothetical protein